MTSPSPDPQSPVKPAGSASGEGAGPDVPLFPPHQYRIGAIVGAGTDAGGGGGGGATPEDPGPVVERGADRVFAGLLGAWALGMGALYFDAYPLKLDLWKGAREGWDAPWAFPLESLRALGIAGAVVIAGWSLGWRVLGRRVREDLPRHALATLGGLALLAMAVFALGLAGFLKSWAMWTLLGICGAGPLALGPREWVGAAREALGRLWDGRPRSLASGAAALAMAVALVVSLLGALGPALESDGLRYHLFAPQEYLRHGKIFYIPNHAFTNFPFLIEMLFTVGLGLGNDSAAKVLHWVHLPLIAVVIGGLVRRIAATRGGPLAVRGGWEEAGPWLAGALFVSTPVAAVVASWSFIDLGTVAHLLAAVLLLVDAGRRLDAKTSALAGFFAGAAVATKYTCVVPAALFFGAVAVLVWRGAAGMEAAADRGRRLWRCVGAFVLAGCVCAAPWFVRNVVWTGNPVYPLAWGIFGGGEWSAENQKFYMAKASEQGVHRGPGSLAYAGTGERLVVRVAMSLPAPARRVVLRGLDLAMAPFDTALYWAEFESQNPGPGYLLLLPALLLVGAAGGWRGGSSEAVARYRWVLALAGGLAVVFLLSYASNRFLLVVWGLGAVLGGAAVVRCAGGWSARVIAAMMICAAAYQAHWVARYLGAEASPRAIPLALGYGDRMDAALKSLNYYAAMQWTAVRGAPGEKVFYIGEHRGYPAVLEPGVSDWFDTPLVLSWIRKTKDNEELVDGLRASGYRYALVNLQELSMYSTKYFRPRFSEPEWKRFEELLASPRLRRAWPAKGGVYVAELTGRK